jgi:ATP-dependent DNA helicase RecG
MIGEQAIMTDKELEIILQEGESYKIEFKESIDKTLVEEVVAFANASGGRIFIGVTDDGNLKGTDTSNIARSRLQDTLRPIQPFLAVTIDIIADIFVVTVPDGPEKPYGCSRGFFIRVGPNSQKLNRNEIIDFIQSEGRIRFDELVKSEAFLSDYLDREAFNRFVAISGISNVLPEEPMLRNLGCVVKVDNQSLFTNTGVLFFAKDPIGFIPQAIIICALYKGIEKVTVLDRKDLTGNIIANIEEAILFLKKHLKLRYEITSIRRKEILEIPEVAMREAIVNAVCHRDYFEKGANVMVEIFDDRVEISNPGGLAKGLSLEDFGTRSLTRNPTIASLLHRTNYIERMGTGINRIRLALQEAGLPAPEFKMSGFFTVIFRRITSDKIGINFGLNSEINETQRHILKDISNDSTVTIKKIAENLGLTSRSIESNIKDLKERGVLVRQGSKKAGRWQIISNSFQAFESNRPGKN